MLEKLALQNISQDDRDFLNQFYTLDDKADWQLSEQNGIYCIGSKQQQLSLMLDFNAGNYQYRNSHPTKEPLVKAVKIKHKLPDTLIDATPGVLKDSLMLAGRGVKITAIERNPIVFVMVRRALTLLGEQSSIDYHFGDACELLPHFFAEIIYLDPMYPPKKKNAQVKKDMQILHHIVGADNDADALLVAAQTQCSRVVVKRPNYAESLGNKTPSFTSQTGTTRFDVYLRTT